ncbi:MAG: alpha/beta fold hydrolase [Simkania negevensis]|nr:alpha/beta fold hydrolase [Simkania negevensis]
MTAISSSPFQARWDYGPKEGQLSPKSTLSRFFKDLFTRLCKSYIYPGAYPFSAFSQRRVDQARNLLETIGGESVAIKTADGDLLDGMYISASRFKSIIEKYFCLVEKDNGDGTVSQQLYLKAEYYTLERMGMEYYHQEPNEEARDLLEKLESILTVRRDVSVSESPQTLGTVIELGATPKDLPQVGTEDLSQSQPTALLATGAASSYLRYKRLAVAYLMRGMNVMLIDQRGYGKSQGNPTDDKTKLDLEAVYQYLQQKKNIKNQHLLVHGYCMGGGIASDLAARRKGVNLLLDRSFAEYRDVGEALYPSMRAILHRILPWIADYNNAKNLEKVQGHIAIETDSADEAIPQSQVTKLIDHLPDTIPGQQVKMMGSHLGHEGIEWMFSEGVNQFDQFLEQAALRRKLF